jgi:hypothetical protein
MKRRKFLELLGMSSAAVVAAPLIACDPEPKKKPSPLKEAKPREHYHNGRPKMAMIESDTIISKMSLRHAYLVRTNHCSGQVYVHRLVDWNIGNCERWYTMDAMAVSYAEPHGVAVETMMKSLE